MTQPPHWPRWPQGWPPHSDSHSTEVEHRLTTVEIAQEHQDKLNAKVKSRLTWHDRYLQAIAAVLYLLASNKAHDQVPTIAEILLRTMGMMK